MALFLVSFCCEPLESGQEIITPNILCKNLCFNRAAGAVKPDEDGGYIARTKLANGSIITQGDTLDELKHMIKDAVSGYFFDRPNELPKTIRLQVDEVFALA